MKKIKQKGVWRAEVFECQCWKALLETAENKNDEKLFMVLISLQVEQTCERVCVKGCNSGQGL